MLTIRHHHRWLSSCHDELVVDGPFFSLYKQDTVKLRHQSLPLGPERWAAAKQLHPQLSSASTVNHCNTTGIDAARINVVLGTVGPGETFTFASSVAHDVSHVSRFTLQP